METKVINGISIIKGEDGLWRDLAGTVYGLAEDDAIGDPVVRCGVGALSLPVDSEFTPACAGHDFSLSSPAFMTYHTRSEADRALLDRSLLVAGDDKLKRAGAYAMYGVCRALSWIWWDVPETRWK